MAGTKQLNKFGDNQGREGVFGVDYGDDLKVLTFWCDNDTMQSAFGTLKAFSEDGTESATAVYAGEFPGKAVETDPPKRTIITIDPQPNRQIVLRPSPVGNGRLAGCVMSHQFPFGG